MPKMDKYEQIMFIMLAVVVFRLTVFDFFLWLF